MPTPERCREPVAAQLPSDVEAILNSAESPEEVSAIFYDDLLSGYRPEADGFEVHEWLSMLSAQVGDALRG